MAYRITNECTCCGICVGKCPAEAIKEGDGKYEIDQETCISCGICAGECPVDAVEEV